VFTAFDCIFCLRSSIIERIKGYSTYWSVSCRTLGLHFGSAVSNRYQINTIKQWRSQEFCSGGSSQWRCQSL